MKNHIIFFSGGRASFTVAHLVKERNPNDNIVLYFTDTLWEDEDLYRFIYEASDKLELPMLTHSRGITPPQLMVLQRFMANNRVGTCSKELKMKVSTDFLKNGIVPEIEKWHNKHYLKNDDFITVATLYFGIGWDEAHREGPIRTNWQPFAVEMPLMDMTISHEEALRLYGIRRPRLYDMEFTHNNCKGRCVKAGQGHYKNLLLKDEKTYMELMEQEVIISAYIRYTKQYGYKKEQDYLFDEVYEFVSTGKKSAKIQHLLNTNKYTKGWNFGTDSKGRDIKKQYTFMKSLSLEELEKRPTQCDLFDIGGCGCFVDGYNELESEVL